MHVTLDLKESIVTLFLEKKTQVKIAEGLGISQSSVPITIGDYKKTGSCLSKNLNTRRRKFDEEDINVIKKINEKILKRL
jgi:transposase